MDAAVVTVGDEILSGDTENTNATWLCRRLTDRGADVRRVTVVPDREGDIARVVNEYRADYDAVVVTGGLGPTHDDVTVEAVAAALGRSVERHPEALSYLVGERGYDREDLAPDTAALPAGARPIHNEVGVAPGAVVDSVYVLPGPPEEMRAAFESVADDFSGTPRHRAVIVVDEYESELLDRIDRLRERFDVSVGSYPGENVRIRIESPDPETVDRAARWFRERVSVAADAGDEDDDPEGDDSDAGSDG